MFKCVCVFASVCIVGLFICVFICVCVFVYVFVCVSMRVSSLLLVNVYVVWLFMCLIVL